MSIITSRRSGRRISGKYTYYLRCVPFRSLTPSGPPLQESLGQCAQRHCSYHPPSGRAAASNKRRSDRSAFEQATKGREVGCRCILHSIRNSFVFRVTSTSTSEGLSSLAILVEIIGVLQMPGSLELVSCLLETLNKITSSTPPDIADRQYVEQLIMSAVENVVQQFPVNDDSVLPFGHSLRQLSSHRLLCLRELFEWIP